MISLRFMRTVILATTSMMLCACLMDDNASSSANFRISITNLGDAAVVATADNTINLIGTVESTEQITSVSWKNDRGGRGTAAGTDHWSTGNIVLQVGRNNITLTARDNTGNSTVKTVAVDRDGAESPGGNNSATGSATLSWNAPTQRTDNSALTNLAGFKIQYGLTSGSFNKQVVVNNASVNVYTLDNLSSGTWKFRVRAFDARGNTSNASTVKTKTIP